MIVGRKQASPKSEASIGKVQLFPMQSWGHNKLSTVDVEAGLAEASDLRAPKVGPSKLGDNEDGTLRVHLLRGEGLKAADKTGTSDPFVKLTLGRQQHSSKTIKKTTHPNWNQQFEFKGVREVLVAQQLELNVFDRDLLSMSSSKHDFLGTAKINLTPMLTSRWRLHKVVLTTRKAIPSMGSSTDVDLGFIHLVISWEGAGQAQLGIVQMWLAAVWERFLEAAAKCIVSPLDTALGRDPMALPTLYNGKKWAERQYYMITVDGPRAGECSDQPVSLGWLQQAVEMGQLPREVKVWAVEGGTSWVILRKVLDKVLRAETTEEKKSALGTSSTHLTNDEKQTAQLTLQAAARGRQTRREIQKQQTSAKVLQEAARG